MSKKPTPEEFWTDFVKRDFQFFKGIYSSEKEMLDYGLKLQKIGDTTKAFLELYSISEFYITLKSVQDGFVKLIMIISLIERLASNKDYVDFSTWLKANESENGNARKAWNNYNDRDGYGCSHKFRNFFKNPDYLTKSEQISLVQSVKFYSKYKGKRVSAPLFCYQEKCGRGNRDCVFHYDQKPVLHALSMNGEEDEYFRYGIEDCPLFQDGKLLNKTLNELANFIYQMRNKFVHNATLFHLAKKSQGFPSLMIDYIEYDFRHIREFKFKGTILLELSSEKLEEFLNRNFKKMLESYIASRVGNTA